MHFQSKLQKQSWDFYCSSQRLDEVVLGEQGVVRVVHVINVRLRKQVVDGGRCEYLPTSTAPYLPTAEVTSNLLGPSKKASCDEGYSRGYLISGWYSVEQSQQSHVRRRHTAPPPGQPSARPKLHRGGSWRLGRRIEPLEGRRADAEILQRAGHEPRHSVEDRE